MRSKKKEDRDGEAERKKKKKRRGKIERERGLKKKKRKSKGKRYGNILICGGSIVLSEQFVLMYLCRCDKKRLRQQNVNSKRHEQPSHIVSIFDTFLLPYNVYVMGFVFSK